MNPSYFIDRFYNKSPRMRLFISKILFGDKDVKVKLLGTELAINTLRESGYFRASNISQTSSLFRDEAAIFVSLSMILSHGDTFVDVGANVGIFSSLLSRFSRLHSDFTVCAFEANSDTYKRLRSNADKHGFKSFNIGISDRECELEFIDGAVSHVFTTIKNTSAYNIPNKTSKVKCQRLDSFDITGNSIIIKIDVEGQELEVLEGAKTFFDDKRVKAVYLDGFAQQEKVIAFLNNYGFSFVDGISFSVTDGKLFSLLAIMKNKL